MRSQHEMKCIGMGLHPNSPLEYVAEIQTPELIGTTKIRATATGEEILRYHIGKAYPTATIKGIRIL
jgi:hypothetical protein